MSSQPATRKLPVVLLALLLAISVPTMLVAPAGIKSWSLEVVPGLLLVAFMAASYRRFPLSNWVYIGTFLHILVLIYGGMYTYAETPLGNWARDAFDLSRNHYDRVGHVALGLFPAFFAREVLRKRTPLSGAWLAVCAWSIVFAFGAFWELLEWWAALLLASDVGQAFLGSQGDVWDAQWDMLLVGVGAAIALLAFSRPHERSMAQSAPAPDHTRQPASN
ncbi:MAG: DUF2238 domain-containing protein [Myxococcales bacterium]|nr:DUF2238 domain-containing protein [Myxococcales bacterium]